MNVALLSPNKNTYSETFIRLQQVGLEKNHTVFYYYDGFVPKRLEGKTGSIILKFAGLKKRLGLISNIRLASLEKSFKQNKIDVVLAQYGPTGNAVCQLCYDLNIPLVVHFHGYDASVKAVIEKNVYYQQLFKMAKRVIAVSKEMVSDLEALGCHPNKIVYNPCAPNNLFFNAKRSSVLKKQFVALGRFTDKKAPYLTILAFNKVVKKHPDAKLIFGGDGELLNTCVNLVKYLKLEANVEFKGIMKPNEFKDVLEESLAFVQHSIKAANGDKEGTPVAVMEASLAGVPVISTRHAGIKDVVINNTTGLLSDEHDVKSMANHMIKVINNIDNAKKMGARGKHKTFEKLRMEVHIDRLETILVDAINSLK